MTFRDVIGQEEVRDRLLQMVAEDRLPHALMLCGPTGCGKKALAIAFGCYLLSRQTAASQPASMFDTPSMFGDEESSPSPASAPPSPDFVESPMLQKLEHPDLHFTYPTIKLPSMSSDHKPVSDDFAREWHELLMQQGPYFSMDQWLQAIGAENQQAIITAGESDELVRKLSLKSSQGGYKVSIVWLPERMNTECANKLLKLIEEPPQQTVFLMVCEEPDKLLETIRSRVQRIDVKALTSDVICQALIERRGIDELSAKRVSRVAHGSWLRALGELQSGSENEAFLELFILLMRLAYQRNVKELRKWSDTMAGFGREKQRRFLTYFLHMIRESFVYNFGDDELRYMTLKEEQFAKNFARFINEANVLPIVDLAERALRDIGQNANSKIVFFDFALQMIVLLIQDK